jgi:cytochrome c553
MRAIAAALSDQDIANLAAYYARGEQTTTASK